MSELDDVLRDVLEAMPHKRWTLTLSGDWEDGWVADASSRGVGGTGYVEVTTEGQGWGADRGGLPTPAEALRALAAKLRAESL